MSLLSMLARNPRCLQVVHTQSGRHEAGDPPAQIWLSASRCQQVFLIAQLPAPYDARTWDWLPLTSLQGSANPSFYHAVASADLMCTDDGSVVCPNFMQKSVELVTVLDVQQISSNAVANSPELCIKLTQPTDSPVLRITWHVINLAIFSTA